MLPFNITNPGILIANLPTSQEATYLTNLVLAGSTASENDVLTWKSGAPSWEAPTGGGGSGVWGSITGTLSAQTDLQSALDGKAPALGTDDNYVTDAEKAALHSHSNKSVLDATTASFTTADETKLDYITVTQAVDLDQIESDTTTNNAKVTNATHTGEVTGSGALTLDKTAISNRTDTPITASDYIIFGDASDADNLKKDTVQGIIDLIGASSTSLDDAYNNGSTITADTDAVTITVPDTSNNSGLIINQNDVTNNPTPLRIYNYGSGYDLELTNNRNGHLGSFVAFAHNSASPASGDYIGGFDAWGNNSAAIGYLYGYMNILTTNVTSGNEGSEMVFGLSYQGSVDQAFTFKGNGAVQTDIRNDFASWSWNGVSDQWYMYFDTNATTPSYSLVTGNSRGIAIYPNATETNLQSNGNYNLVLRTGNATTGSITIADGANGDISLTPNGSGKVKGPWVPRTGTTTSSATPTINTDNVDEYYITAQAVDITSFTTNLSGTPALGQQLFISIVGTAARAITWGASFANGPVALPTTTVTTTQLSVLLKWDGSIWRCYASGSTV